MATKNINYLSRDFSVFKQQLIDYAKTYYPNTYTDFSPSSPGTMFIEMASYVGDVLSFYLDNQIQENFLQYAKQQSNLYSLAYMMGYKPKVTSPSSVTLTFYQRVPATLDGGVWVPDFNYALKLGANSEIGSTLNSPSPFLVGDEVDFSFSSSLDPTDVSVYSVSNNQPEYFLLKKTRKAISATIQTSEFSFGAPQQFPTVNINSSNIIGILDCVDSEGNDWYEVDYLAQDAVFDSIKNTNVNDPNFSSDNSDTPYLLKLKQADRRFATRFTSPSNLQLQFGSGVVANDDETIVPNPDNVGMGLPFEKDKLTTAFSPTNFIFTDSYGIAPSNTTLYVRYLTGGGVTSNVQSGLLNTLSSGNLSFVQNNLTNAQDIYDSFQVINLEAADGGSDGDSLEEIRQNSVAQFQSQLRTVTEYDYLVRALSLPSQYGSLAKVYAQTPTANSTSLTDENVAVIDLYCLSYNNSKQLQTPSTALKNNLKTYLSQYRMIGDTVNVKNGYIINIGVEFDIIVLPNYNSNEVLITCINALTNYFNIDNWQINQPIILRDLYILLDRVPGVQSVKNILITNKSGEANGYSAYGYDVTGATINGVLYPSLDPSIFELKYPNADLKGRVVSY
jgi:hypothetical protein